MRRRALTLEPSVPVIDVITSKCGRTMQTPFLDDPVYVTPSGKRVEIVWSNTHNMLIEPSEEPPTDLGAPNKGAPSDLTTWAKARARCFEDEESFAKLEATVRYLGTGAVSHLPFADLAVVEEYFDRAPIDFGNLPKDVYYRKNLAGRPQKVKLLAVGRTRVLYQAPDEPLREGLRMACYLLSPEEIPSLKEIHTLAWTNWWQESKPPLLRLNDALAGREAPWDLADRRELAYTGEATVTLPEVLSDNAPLSFPLVPRTPCVSPEGRKGVIDDAFVFKGPGPDGAGASLEAGTWRRARELYQAGCELKFVAVSYGGARTYLASEIVRIPLSALLSAPPFESVSPCEVAYSYDYASGSVLLAVKGSKEGAKALEIADGEFRDFRYLYAQLVRARAAIDEWIASHEAAPQTK